MFSYVQNWWNDWTPDPESRARLVAQNIRGAVFRSALMSGLFAAAFTTYGFTSLEYIQRHQPNANLLSNVGLRFLFNGLPFAVLSLFLLRSKVGDRAKLRLWLIVFPLVINAASWIYVWPLMLTGNNTVYGPFHAANIYVFAICFIAVSPPNRYLLLLVASSIVGYWAPLLWVIRQSGDSVLLKLVALDVLHTTILNCLGSTMIYKIRVRLSKMEHQRQSDASKFLGDTVSNAIFQNRTHSLVNKKVTGVIAASDIRGYTEMMTKFPQEEVAKIMDGYHALMSEAVAKYGGFIHKSTGDGHIMTFGVMDEQVDLSDIPGIDEEAATAARNRNQSLVRAAASACREVMDGLAALVATSGLGVKISVGAAIDFGEMELRTIGNKQHRLEYDIFGRTVIRAARLEGHTKALRKNMFHDASMLILSDEAAQIGAETEHFIRVNTRSCPVRDFPEIQQLWVQLFWPGGVQGSIDPAVIVTSQAA